MGYGGYAGLGVRADEGVAIVTIDTYRLAAVEQLRAFADILQVPCEVAFTAIDLRRAIQRHASADRIFIEEIRNAGLYDEIWQALAVLFPVRTVGVMGDARTYDHVCALRAVTSTDGMTADSYPFEHSFIARVATRIINEVQGINRVVYDVTSKPPGTIEWE